MTKPLHIPPDKKWPGLTIWCGKCKSTVFDICKSTNKPLKNCHSGENHSFKVYSSVPGTKNTRKTKNLKTRNYEEAVQEAIQFHKEVKNKLPEQNLNFRFQQPKEQHNFQPSLSTDSPKLFLESIAKYIAQLRGENVPKHLKVERTEDYLKDVERHFERMVLALQEAGIDTHILSVTQVNDHIVGVIYNYLLEVKKYSNRTFNKAIGYYSSFISWYIDEYNVTLRNPFRKVKRKKINHNPKAISKEQFELILNEINLTSISSSKLETKDNIKIY